MKTPKKSTLSNTTNKNLAKASSEYERIVGTLVSKVGAGAVADDKRNKLRNELIGKMVMELYATKPPEEVLALFADIEALMKKSERALISTHELRPEGVDEIVAKADADALKKKRAAVALKAQEDLEKAKQALLKAEEKAKAVQAGDADDATLPVLDTAPDTDAVPGDNALEAGRKPAVGK